jgi:hypothetical protein
MKYFIIFDLIVAFMLTLTKLFNFDNLLYILIIKIIYLLIFYSLVLNFINGSGWWFRRYTLQTTKNSLNKYRNYNILYYLLLDPGKYGTYTNNINMINKFLGPFIPMILHLIDIFIYFR